MDTITRLIKIELPKGQSAFLWGPRKTGKTTYLRATFPNSRVYDLLQTDLFLEFVKRPFLLREQLLAASPKQLKEPVIIDEVQKVPQLLDEIHWLIENKGLRFILCGSSARKLKRGKANLLGGRAWRYEMHPLVSAEVADLNLLQALNRGMLPRHYMQEEYHKSLQAYVRDYLKEEVFDEGLSRNIPAFSRFFEAMGFSHGELTNYANIARDCGVDAKTVKEYYQILGDTNPDMSSGPSNQLRCEAHARMKPPAGRCSRPSTVTWMAAMLVMHVRKRCKSPRTSHPGRADGARRSQARPSACSGRTVGGVGTCTSSQMLGPVPMPGAPCYPDAVLSWPVL